MLPETRDLVLIGGGHTHALVLRAWGMNPLPGVRVTLINPAPTAAYSGMLPGFVAGHYTRDELDIDLVKLARFAQARLITGIVTSVDKDQKVVMVPGRPPIMYDACSIDIGITSNMPDLPGFLDYGVPAKPLAPFAQKWDGFRTSNETGNIIVVGAGVAGVELAMAMKHAMPQASLHVLDRSKALTALGNKARQGLKQQLGDFGIELTENAEVVRIKPKHVELSDGQILPSDFTVGAAGAEPFAWPSEIGLDMHAGYVAVNRHLQSSDPSIFAAGDCAHLTDNPRPKAGVFAVREAPFLFDNLRAVLSGGTLTAFKPQKDYLKLISLGGRSALAEKFGAVFSGPLLWRWKDWIDRAFMAKFDELPAMSGPELPRTAALGLADALVDKPLCAGCGSKVGKSALRSALRDVPLTGRNDVERLAGDDAGIVRIGGERQVISTDHLRAFTEDPVMMTRIACMHALGDIWAMGAKPQAATFNITLPRLSEELQKRTMSEIMTTAHEVLGSEGAAILGGHSSMGSEFSIGLTITGMLGTDPVTIGGAKPGDVLILTKPIGSGVILAAEMLGEARGHDVTFTLDQMCRSQAKAAEILSGAHAMTDVTGFGLLGHLWGICEASGVSVELKQDSVPFFPGAADLSAQGHRSSIFASNVAAVGSIVGSPKDLLFDPQTSGGLLAAVPKDQAEASLAQLVKAGYDMAAVIGEVSEGPANITVR